MYVAVAGSTPPPKESVTKVPSRLAVLVKLGAAVAVAPQRASSARHDGPRRRSKVRLRSFGFIMGRIGFVLVVWDVDPRYQPPLYCLGAHGSMHWYFWSFFC